MQVDPAVQFHCKVPFFLVVLLFEANCNITSEKSGTLYVYQAKSLTCNMVILLRCFMESMSFSTSIVFSSNEAFYMNYSFWVSAFFITADIICLLVCIIFFRRRKILLELMHRIFNIISILILFAVATLAFWQLSSSFYFIATEGLSAASQSMICMSISHNLKMIAFVLPSVAVGLICSQILQAINLRAQIQ